MASISCGGLYGYANNNTSYGYFKVYFDYDSVTRSGSTVTINNARVRCVGSSSQGYTTNTIYINSCKVGGTSSGISGTFNGKTYWNSTWTSSKKTFSITGVAGATTSLAIAINSGRSGATSGQNQSGTLTIPKGEYTITYNANGGSGAPAAQTATAGVAATLSSTKPTRTGYTFRGWGTASRASLVRYSAGGSITDSYDTVLYALWEAIPAVKVKSGSSWIVGDLMYKSGSSYLPASTIKLKAKSEF